MRDGSSILMAALNDLLDYLIELGNKYRFGPIEINLLLHLIFHESEHIMLGVQGEETIIANEIRRLFDKFEKK